MIVTGWWSRFTVTSSFHHIQKFLWQMSSRRGPVRDNLQELEPALKGSVQEEPCAGSVHYVHVNLR